MLEEEIVTVLEFRNVVPRFNDIRFRVPVNFALKANQNLAIVGPNGAGKSILADLIAGKYALKSGEIYKPVRVKNISFKDIYSIVDMRDGYYQQRWNIGLENGSPKVSDIIELNVWTERLVSVFSVSALLKKNVVMLSSGELRKFLIIRALSSNPDILVIDNPYIGLDSQSRVILNNFLEDLTIKEHINIILILPVAEEIPPIITHVLPVKDKEVYIMSDVEKFKKNTAFLFSSDHVNKEVFNGDSKQSESETLVKLMNVSIRYGENVILDNVNWEIKKGDKWVLLGKNGSGKSTLLGLIYGDNPQAYSNDIHLFGRKRGTGESIWDIKKHIGYVSPEMHIYYRKNTTCIDVVGSGFFDTIGLYNKCNPEQLEKAEYWMSVFGVAHLKDRNYMHISTGEQRLVLLARVFVKNPELLILDEPLHGLDSHNKQKVINIINDFCGQDKALIYVTHQEEEIPRIINKVMNL